MFCVELTGFQFQIEQRFLKLTDKNYYVQTQGFGIGQLFSYHTFYERNTSNFIQFCSEQRMCKFMIHLSTVMGIISLICYFPFFSVISEKVFTVISFLV